MQYPWVSFGIGVVAGLRTMTACAALSWATALGRSRVGWIPAGPIPRTLATAAALAEMTGDKMPFAPDRRIPPSVAVRLVIGALGGAALAKPDGVSLGGPLAGIAGALVGTFAGRRARGGTTRSGADWARAFTEDAVAAGLAMALVYTAERETDLRR